MNPPREPESPQLISLFGSKPTPYRLASELNAPEFKRAATKPLREKRGMISIGVIDDEPFAPKENLENVGYKIVLVGDPSTIEAVKAHQIVLCDLQGVGRALDAKNQGSFIIREIKNNFPDKYVVAYSGGALHVPIIRTSTNYADAFLKKDVDIETWREKLDSIIDELLDPYWVWLRQRRALIDRDVDTLTILQLEDAFVKSIAARGNPSDSPLARYVQSGEIRNDVRAIIQSLIASAVFKLLVG